MSIFIPFSICATYCTLSTDYRDDTGKQNPYQGYLKELADHHSCPVVILEFGVPASRSQAYADIWSGAPHGGLNEREQGEAVVKLYEDIQKAGCNGAILFTWQDEWYKTIWNERLLSDPDGRAYWSNAQCAEQFFGVLAFEPGDATAQNYPDGDLSEWAQADFLVQNKSTSLSMKSDEKYLYFLAEGLDARREHDHIRIALDVTSKTGASQNGSTVFSSPVDFYIQIRKNGTGVIFVHKAWDMTVFSDLGRYNDKSYGNIHSLLTARIDGMFGNNEFQTVARASSDILSKQLSVWKTMEVGLLKQGNANPASPDYDSNADYFVSGDAVEIRIPWQMLNLYDPSQCMIIDDYHETGYRIQGLKIDRIYAAAYCDDQPNVSQFGSYQLRAWDQPRFHERLKQSYYILQEAFAKEKTP